MRMNQDPVALFWPEADFSKTKDKHIFGFRTI